MLIGAVVAGSSPLFITVGNQSESSRARGGTESSVESRDGGTFWIAQSIDAR
jgi:hypothetical protein